MPVRDPSMYAFTKSMRNAEHTRHYLIQPTGSGWEVRQENDNRVVRQACYQDWHRVERVRRAFVLEVAALRAEGWQEVSS
jgi:hypothetical protein